MLRDVALIQPTLSSALGQVELSASLATKGCRIVEFPRITDPRGNLTFIEAGDTSPSRSSVSTTSMTCPVALSAVATRTGSCDRS